MTCEYSVHHVTCETICHSADNSVSLLSNASFYTWFSFSCFVMFRPSGYGAGIGLKLATGNGRTC